MLKHIESSPIITCEISTRKNFKNLTGLRFGKLLVVGLLGKRRYGGSRNSYLWSCVCDCGKISVVEGGNLSSNTRSCGCLIGKSSISHGMSQSCEFGCWNSMIQRCTNPKSHNWRRYGGRGIKVCDRWMRSFKSFFNDMGNKPSRRHSIERLNNNGDYEPNNCVWDTGKPQCRNRANNVLLTLNGRTLCIAEWSEKITVRCSILYGRKRRGWSDEKILTEPV